MPITFRLVDRSSPIFSSGVGGVVVELTTCFSDFRYLVISVPSANKERCTLSHAGSGVFRTCERLSLIHI